MSCGSSVSYGSSASHSSSVMLKMLNCSRGAAGWVAVAAVAVGRFLVCSHVLIIQVMSLVLYLHILILGFTCSELGLLLSA